MRLHISENRRHLATRDGTPFFWLADTAWNAALRADTDDWATYLDARAEQGFTVIQFVSGPWRGCRTPRHGRLYEEVGGRVRFDERAFEKMEEWLTMVTDRGLVPAPVMIWDNNPDDPLFSWSIESCVEAGRRMVEEWSRFHPVWILAGDGDYRSREQALRWKRIGAEVFPPGFDGLATMHPCGCTWVGDVFASEPWYSIVGIQSGHGSVHHDLDFLLAGPYSYRWRAIEKPFINLEPNYEMALSYGEKISFTDYHVRRASWWSVLGAPTAGVTYGNNNIWVWAREDREQAEGHGDIWVAGKWQAGIDTPGIRSLGVMRRIIDDLPWTRLRPANELLARQPGWADPNDFIVCARTDDRSCVVAYLPRGGEVSFTGDLLPEQGRYWWVNPRNGERGQELALDGNAAAAPTAEDWLFVMR